ncbi:hypothetical protein [Azovibrio restrictus]|uniref:hypothetical protein n=1 Tax=Azovibrio restrictus TaxID=146938 RepID=UPI0026F26343|nr:hypothetical protein [Azovibrio restrictus]MDD3483007.1 hypothetical protein [Azovibrio restrictus]
MALSLRQEAGEWWLQLRPGPGEQWDIRQQEGGRLRLQVRQGSPRLLRLFLPREHLLATLGLLGRLDGQLDYGPGGLQGQLELKDGGFSSADGRLAAEGLGLSLSVSGRQAKGGWQLQGRLVWHGGAFYREPVLLQGAAQSLDFSGSFAAGAWRLDQAVLNWPRVGAVRGWAAGDRNGFQEAELEAADLALESLGVALLQPLLEARGLPRAILSGRARVLARWQQGGLSALEFEPRGAGLELEGGRLSLEGLEGQLHWDRQQIRTGALRVGRLALGRLESGSFQLPLALRPEGVALSQRVSIPFLDSELILDHLQAGLGPDGQDWEGTLGLSIYPVSLEALTWALGLPPMGGLLSANLPAIRYARGEASLEGALVIQVFDGYLNCTDLRLIDPFGTVPRILADVEARHIDLGQLTQTFSFGQMTGYVDAELKALEISAWRPLAFKARIVSSPGSYPRRISQKAVADITALGGGGAMAAIQSSFLRFFQDFGYRRIGLSCQLENGVCRMGGIEGLDRQGAYAIVEGGGIPALTVIGYNRDVHWDELVARLKAAISNPSRPVID